MTQAVSLANIGVRAALMLQRERAGFQSFGRREGGMLAMWVKVRVKPDERERFLKAIEVYALGSERDEPGCMRFNVLQDAQDQNV